VDTGALLSHGWPVAALALWIGLSVGSFLNVVIYRLPVMLDRTWRRQSAELLELATSDETPSGSFNLLVPRSRCGSCGTSITWWQNIPVLSWLALKGRCASCGTSISARYPLVESLTAVCSLAVLGVYGYTWTAAFALLFTWTLVALAFIDFDTRLLPDNLTLPLLWLGLTLNLGTGFTDLSSAVVGAMAGYLTLWGVYWIFKWITGKEGMGYGDFKLLGAFGAWFGWQSLPMLILLSSVAGVVVGGAYLLIRRSREPIPFGPFLAIAGWVMLIGHDRVVGVF